MSKNKNDKKAIAIAIVFLLILGVIAAFVMMMVFERIQEINMDNQNVSNTYEQVEEEPEPEPVKLRELDLQGVVDDWKTGDSAVAIYDLDLETYIAKNNIEKSYPTQSLYKLPVVYVGYMKIFNDEWEPSADAECLDLAIRESSISCGETLKAKIGAANVNLEMKRLGVEGVNVVSLTTTASGMIDLLKVIYKHHEISQASAEILFDSMLNQPPSAGYAKEVYDWRRGLPSGFSDDAKVYNKVGWYSEDGVRWSSYNDAAIVELKDADNNTRHLAVVVLTKGINYKTISKLGTKIEEAVKTN